MPATLKPRPYDPWIGCVVDGRYSIRDFLGTDGLVRTYVARDELLGDVVLLQRISPPQLTARFLLRLRANVLAVARLHLPRVILVRDYAIVAGDVIIATEFFVGQTLAARLAQVGRFPAHKALPVLVELADALAALHERQIVHLGLTPNTIYLDSVLGVRVAEVGLARVLDEMGADFSGNAVVDASAYLAPEQVTASAISSATDIYAFGAVAFEMLTGHVPSSRALTSTYNSAPGRMERHEPPHAADFARDVPEALSALVARCLASDPTRRPRDGAELKAVLERIEILAPGGVRGFIARASGHRHALSARAKVVEGQVLPIELDETGVRKRVVASRRRHPRDFRGRAPQASKEFDEPTEWSAPPDV